MELIPDHTVAAIKERLSDVDVISGYVQLKRSGRGWVGLCPFHDEKTPSFHVFGDGDGWHCFGCGEGGDLIRFVEQVEHLDFPEAARLLADRAGVVIDYTPDPAAEQRQQVKRVCDQTSHWFQQQLHTTPAAVPAVQWLLGRGFTREMAEAHSIGWAPGGELLGWLRGQRCAPDLLGKAGLLNADGTKVLFRNRIVWPITDERGNTVGFSGRALGDAKPKYINTPTTELYDKSRTLYRWPHAAKQASKDRCIYITEGVTDVMAVEGVGCAAVATCGTAFTERHLAMLIRRLDGGHQPAGDRVRLVFVFDGDSAGRAAMRKAWGQSVKYLARCDAVQLPAGVDPADLWRTDPEQLHRRLTNPVSLTELVLTDLFVATAGTDPTPDTVALAAAEVTGLLDHPDLDANLRTGWRRWAETTFHVELGDTRPPGVEPAAPTRDHIQPQPADGHLHRQAAAASPTSPTREGTPLAPGGDHSWTVLPFVQVWLTDPNPDDVLDYANITPTTHPGVLGELLRLAADHPHTGVMDDPKQWARELFMASTDELVRSLIADAITLPPPDEWAFTAAADNAKIASTQGRLEHAPTGNLADWTAEDWDAWERSLS